MKGPLRFIPSGLGRLLRGSRRAQRPGQGRHQGGGHRDDRIPRQVVPEPPDVGAPVCKKGEDQGADRIHPEADHGRQHDHPGSPPGATYPKPREEEPGRQAGNQAPHPAAGLAHPDRGAGEFDDIALAVGGNPRMPQGLRDALGDQSLQGERHLEVSSRGQRRGERAKEGRHDRGPSPIDEPDPVVGQAEPGREEKRPEAQARQESSHRVVKAQCRGIEAPGHHAHAPDHEQQEEGGRGADRAGDKSAGPAAAFRDQDRDQDRDRRTVGQVRIRPPGGRKEPDKPKGQKAQSGHVGLKEPRQPREGSVAKRRNRHPANLRLAEGHARRNPTGPRCGPPKSGGGPTGARPSADAAWRRPRTGRSRRSRGDTNPPRG